MISLVYCTYCKFTALSCTLSRYLYSLSHTLALHSKDLLLDNHELTSQWASKGDSFSSFFHCGQGPTVGKVVRWLGAAPSFLEVVVVLGGVESLKGWIEISLEMMLSFGICTAGVGGRSRPSPPPWSPPSSPPGPPSAWRPSLRWRGWARACPPLPFSSVPPCPPEMDKIISQKWS